DYLWIFIASVRCTILAIGVTRFLLVVIISCLFCCGLTGIIVIISFVIPITVAISITLSVHIYVYVVLIDSNVWIGDDRSAWIGYNFWISINICRPPLNGIL